MVLKPGDFRKKQLVAGSKSFSDTGLLLFEILACLSYIQLHVYSYRGYTCTRSYLYEKFFLTTKLKAKL